MRITVQSGMERNFLDFLDENMEHKKLDELNLKPFGF